MAVTTGRTIPTPPVDDKIQLEKILEAKPYSRDLLTISDAEYNTALTTEAKQAHYANLLLLMSLVRLKWNGNRKGVMGLYSYRDNQRVGSTDVFSNGEQYLGHNIAAIAVDDSGDVIDFDFNHNDVFRSSLEHAEARLMRRLFSLTGLRADWALSLEKQPLNDRARFATNLSKVTIYTSLEPCAQCAGIMALARVKEVVYLQRDDGARGVANVLYNLKPYGTSPLPIDGSRCGLPHGEELTGQHEAYKRKVSDPSEPPFYMSLPSSPRQETDRGPWLTTFLCTDFAMRVFQKGKDDFETFVASGQTPWGAVDPRRINVKQLQAFLAYADMGGHRGTPH